MTDEGKSCGSCGAAIDGAGYYLELEWPRDEPADPGSAAFYQCGECADALALEVLVARADDRDLDGLYDGLWPDDVDAPESIAGVR